MSGRIERKTIGMGLGAAAATLVAGLIGMAGTVPRAEVADRLWYPLFLAGMVFVIVVTIYWFDSIRS